MRTFDLRGADRREGFTLIELMVVIGIIGILAALGGPSLSAWIYKMRLTSAAASVDRTLNAVRKIAMSENTRYCVTFGSDAAYAGSGPGYTLELTVQVEVALNSAVWAAAPTPEIASWTNDPTTELFKGVSLESTGGGTTITGGADGCSGLVFNNLGYLDNPTTDFSVDCNGQAGAGASCSRLTLVQKYSGEQRTLWVDRGGGVRHSQGPGIEPVPPS